MQRLSFLRSGRIVLALGWSDFLLKYRGSFLGYLWSFVVPLVKFLVILHIFRPFAADIPFYPLYLFLGLLLWEHFSLTTSACINMPQDKAMIIKKVPFSRLLLMFSVGWMHLIILITYLCIFFLFSVLLGHGIPVSTFVYLPFLLLQSTLIALGIGMLLGSYSLKFRDIAHLWGVILQIFFWLTPIMYAYRPSAPILADAQQLLATGLPLSLWSWLDIFIRFQPLSILIHDARRAILYPDTMGMPSLQHIVLFTLICAAIFYAGVIVFRRRSPHFIEEY
jgi:ABC-type polysaccharide/polyol phosphate export permease